EVPFLATDGAGAFVGPRFTLSPGTSRAKVIDPCALLAPSPPDVRPRTTPAPWPAPPYTLSRMGYAHLIPVLGGLVRHDHVHLDVHGKELAVFVDGHRANGPLRSVALGNRQEIAVVFGSRRDLRLVPSTYRGTWPGLGCGGRGEIRC